MADPVVNQEPADLQELLYAKSKPVLANMLAPELKDGVANNYKIVKVERSRGYSIVTLQVTKDPEVDIDTADADQVREVTVNYEHHSLISVLEHFLGKGPYVVEEVPATFEDLEYFVLSKTEDLSISQGIKATFNGNEVSLFVEDPKDLRWYGVAHLTFNTAESAGLGK